MTRAEKSLLLYFETCAVDRFGRVDGDRINEEDIETAKRWDAEGFVGFGRICSADCTAAGRGNLWCRLSDEAFALAHAARRERAQRDWKDRRYKRTGELRQLLGAKP